METGAYTEDIRDLVLNFPGEDVTEGVVPSKRFKHFTCRARSAAATSSLMAVCRRNKYGYSIYITKQRPELIYCETDTGADPKWCKLLTGKSGNPAAF